LDGTVELVRFALEREGQEVCREVRRTSQVPIPFLSSRDEDMRYEA
jgi:DNA-binding response OmpR family regulator